MVLKNPKVCDAVEQKALKIVLGVGPYYSVGLPLENGVSNMLRTIPRYVGMIKKNVYIEFLKIICFGFWVSVVFSCYHQNPRKEFYNYFNFSLIVYF